MSIQNTIYTLNTRSILHYKLYVVHTPGTVHHPKHCTLHKIDLKLHIRVTVIHNTDHYKYQSTP